MDEEKQELKVKEGEPDQLAETASGALLWPSPGDTELVTAAGE